MSTGISISFAPQISAYAKANDLDFSPEAAASLDQTLQATLQLGDGNRISFITGNDKTGTLEDALALYSAGTPRKAAKPAPSRPTPAGSNATARALAANAAVLEGRSAARLVEAQDLVDRHGSPWDPRWISRTRQALVSNLDPDLATRLKREAGVRP